ncbi:MAG: class I SAM-dependent methyltransferase [Cyanobacteria bacterium P01_A01_bin.84]
MSQSNNSSVIKDKKIEAVLNRLHKEADNQTTSLIFHHLPEIPRFLLGKGLKWDKKNIDFYEDKYIPIEKEQGYFIYLLARSINAKTIVEYGTSFGISTIYLATAVRDNGGGLVIGTEIVHKKVVQARKFIAEAGLENYVNILEGDALESLKSLNQTVDMVLIDGWPPIALDVLKLIDPFIRKGGIVISDNIGTFKKDMKSYVNFLQDPANGYCSTTLNLRGGTELAVKSK